MTASGLSGHGDMSRRREGLVLTIGQGGEYGGGRSHGGGRQRPTDLSGQNGRFTHGRGHGGSRHGSHHKPPTSPTSLFTRTFTINAALTGMGSPIHSLPSLSLSICTFTAFVKRQTEACAHPRVNRRPSSLAASPQRKDQSVGHCGGGGSDGSNGYPNKHIHIHLRERWYGLPKWWVGPNPSSFYMWSLTHTVTEDSDDDDEDRVGGGVAAR